MSAASGVGSRSPTEPLTPKFARLWHDDLRRDVGPPWPPTRSTSARASPTPTAHREVLDAAVEAIRSGHNQYPPGPGVPEFAAAAIARHQRRFYGLDHDPDGEVLVTAGATEALAGALLGMLDTDDEVIVFEPMYDSYQACIALAGARAVPGLAQARERSLSVRCRRATGRCVLEDPADPPQHPAQSDGQGVRRGEWP